MPRVVLREIDYKVKDLGNYIRGEMAEQKITQDEMGKIIGTSQQNFGNHLRKVDFNPKQLIQIFKRLDTPDWMILKFMK